MAETRFIAALDVLFPRGNRLFGDAGQHGEAQQMPPWPSLAAGAIRSRMLADGAVDLAGFANGQKPTGRLGDALGTPTEPGSFRLAWFSLGHRNRVGIEPIVPLPADLVAHPDEDSLLYLKPQVVSERLHASHSTPQLAMLCQGKSRKPDGGLWLNGAGLASYLRGEAVRREPHTTTTSRLWSSDPRLGIALDPVTRAAQEGRLYTTEGIAPHTDVGFLAVISGADDVIPKNGLIRLGGDGRGARIEPCQTKFPEPDWDRIGRERRFRIILTTPGLFENGWRLSGLADNETWAGPGGLSARLVSAAVPRAQVVSGWDLAQRKPKPALRAAPAGSVYWFEAPDAEGSALMHELRRLVTLGLGYLSQYPDKTRIAEGFNNVMVANWTAA
ncbi:MAG: type III-B CRISPR module-associated Cmr3 family protein [Deltaproteobacteria bacterium]|nr:type III-B CRISPR module-associated Cmr3 family protein [Deltaproteobacteria bacterium]